MQRAARVNDEANFGLRCDRVVENALTDLHAENEAFVDEILANEALHDFLRMHIRREIYAQLRATPSP